MYLTFIISFKRFSEMVYYCEVSDCKNLARKGSKVQFHHFPLEHQEIVKLWVEALNRKNWQPTTKSLICSCHFKKDDYDLSNGVKVLKENAVPSILSNKNETINGSSNSSDDTSSHLGNPMLAKPTTKRTISDDNTYISDCRYSDSSSTDSGNVVKSLTQPFASTASDCDSEDCDNNRDAPKKEMLPTDAILTLPAIATANSEVQNLFKKMKILHQEIRRLDKTIDCNYSNSSTSDSEFINKEFMPPIASTSCDNLPENLQTTSRIEDSNSDLQDLRKKIKGLQQKLRRRDKTIASLRKTIDYMKNKG